MPIHKAKDNSLKLILGEHDLFVEFLRDFIRIDIFNDVKPSDIEDITERFLPLFQDNKDSDTVKRINLKGDIPLFVIAIVEHESAVNYRSSFKMLQYITLVLTEYELVNLNEYNETDLAEFGDMLSLIMIIDKIKTADGMSLLKKLPPDYVEQLAMNIPNHLNKLIADVITLLLKKINVTKEEIEALTEKIYQRRFQEMFTLIEEYDVQATRREARLEGRQEGRLEGRQEGRLEGELKGKLEDAVNIIKEFNATVTKAMEVTRLPETEREKLIRELELQNILYTL